MIEEGAGRIGELVQRGMWKRIKEEIAIWRVGAVPGIAVIGLVIIARLTGSLQSLEWLALDSFLRLRHSCYSVWRN